MLCVLGGIDNSHTTVEMGLISFMMNEAWRSRSVVKFIRNEWLMQPANLERAGRVLSPMVLVQAPLPPSPPSPYLSSSVQIEEVDLEMEAALAELVGLRDLDAEAEEEAEQNQQLAAFKRRKIS